MEKEIQALAKEEHRTISEFFREAVRQYATRRLVTGARKQGRASLKKKGLKPTDIVGMIREDRKRHAGK